MLSIFGFKQPLDDLLGMTRTKIFNYINMLYYARTLGRQYKAESCPFTCMCENNGVWVIWFCSCYLAELFISLALLYVTWY